jgi:hypothetical protein
MANLLELAQKMGITATPTGVEKKNINPAKRRPWFEEGKEDSKISGVTLETSVETMGQWPKKAPELKVKNGELKKNQEILKQKDDALKKIEVKTDRLIVKAQQLLLESQIKKRAIRAKKEASFFEFNCLKGLPKLILTHVKEKAVYDDSLQRWISIIDTEDLRLITKKESHHLKVQILRLEKQGWFQIIKSRNNGVRALGIDPGLYSIKQ